MVPWVCDGHSQDSDLPQKTRGAPWRAWEPFLLFLFFKRSAV